MGLVWNLVVNVRKKGIQEIFTPAATNQFGAKLILKILLGPECVLCLNLGFFTFIEVPYSQQLDA